MPRRVVLLLALSIGSSVLLSCGTSDRAAYSPPTGAIAARLVFPGAPPAREDRAAALASVDMTGEVDAIRVTVRHGEEDVATKTFAYLGPGGSGTLGGIPKGGNYLVLAEALKGGGAVYRAAVSAVRVEGGQTTQVVAAMLRVKGGEAVLADYGTWLGAQELASTAVAAADLDGDGDPDLVFGDDGGPPAQPNTVLINRLNTPCYCLSERGQALGTARWTGVALGDLDGDADVDIAAASSPYSWIYLNAGSGSFTASTQPLNVPLAEPSSVALGDVDGDGDLDLVFGNMSAVSPTGGAPISFWLNTGTGSFVPGQELGDTHTTALALGDLDGDGAPDLVTAEVGLSLSGTILSGSGRVYLNDGSGVFSQSGQTLDQGLLTSVALGDLDGDGDLDVLYGRSAGDIRLAFMNNGAAVFSSSQALAMPGPVASVALFDVDGDGDLDAAFGGSAGGNVLLNDGTGHFAPGGLVFGQSGIRALAPVDADGDGEADLACAQEGSDRLWINDTAREGARGLLVFAADDGVRGLELWAYDGAADAVTLVADVHPGIPPYSNHMRVLVPFSDKIYFAGDDGVHGCELWAYDGTRAWMAADAYPGRYATYDSTPNAFNPQFFYTDLYRLYIWSQDVPSPYLMWEFDESTAPAVADSTIQALGYYNHRFMARYAGKDYYAGWDADHGRELWADDGISPPSLVADVRVGAASAGVDGLFVFNGRLYFIADDGSHGRELWVYDEAAGARLAYDLQPGSGSSNPEEFAVFEGRLYFSASTNNYNLFEYEGFPDVPRFIMNGGGSKAVYRGNLYLGKYGLLRYNGTTFETVLDPDPGSGYGDVANLVVHDGRLFFTANDGTNGNELWSWDGDMQGGMVVDIGPGSSIPPAYDHPALVSFVPVQRDRRALSTAGTASVGGTASALALTDLDVDRYPDLVEGRNGLPSRVYLNDRSGGFALGQVLGTHATKAVAAGDLDGDKDVDLVLGNDNDLKRIWANSGTGSFTSTGSFGGTGIDAATISLALADIDEDGDLDLAEGIGTYNKDRLWRNNGVGVFGDTGQRMGSGNTRSFSFGDVDGDFDLDLLTGDALHWNNYIYANNGGGSFTKTSQWFGTTYTYAALLGDVDRDGDLDVVQGDSEGGGIRVWINDGAGSFTDYGQRVGNGNTRALALADMDRDGDPDIVEGNYYTPSRIYLNDGSGVFVASDVVLGECAVSAIAVRDLDRDGDADVVLGCEAGPNLIWYSGLWR